MLKVELEVERRVADGVVKVKQKYLIPETIRCPIRAGYGCDIIQCEGAGYNSKSQSYDCPLGNFKKPAKDFGIEC